MGSATCAGQGCGGANVRGETHFSEFETCLRLSGIDDRVLAKATGKTGRHKLHNQSDGEWDLGEGHV